MVLTEKALKIGGSRRRSGGEGSVKMGEADVLMPEKVVESLLGENGDLIQVLMMTIEHGADDADADDDG